MKLTIVTQRTLILAILILSVLGISAQNSMPSAGEVVQNQAPIFYCNPLLLNNKPLNYTEFCIASKGVLTVVAGNPETSDIQKIPFRIYLRRNGTTITHGASDTTRSMLTIDIASILSMAKSGDYLIIEPTHKSDIRARRSIKLKDYFFNSTLFSFIKNKADDC